MPLIEIDEAQEIIDILSKAGNLRDLNPGEIEKSYQIGLSVKNAVQEFNYQQQLGKNYIENIPFTC
jgi:hypothetical protein